MQAFKLLVRVVLICSTSLLLSLPSTVNAASIDGETTGLVSPDILLTFDEEVEEVLVPDVAVTNQYSSFGVTFTGLFYDSSCCIELWDPDGSSPYLGNVTNKAEDFKDWTAQFDTNTTEVAFTQAGNGGSATISAYLNSVLVEEFEFSDANWGYYGFTGIVFNEIRMAAGSAMLIDNFQDTGAAAVIPVPAAIWLFGTALIGMFGFNKKRRKAV